MEVPSFFACPECGSGRLTPADDLNPARAPYDSREGLRCGDCQREYPIAHGVWILWSDEARRIHTEEPAQGSSIADQVKRANVQIYDNVSIAYGEHHDGTRPYAETQLFIKAIADDFQTRAEDSHERVLVDVGCATGVSLDIGSKGYRHCVGVDISLQNLLAVAERGHIAVLADADKLPFREASIDFITCFATLHHFPNPEKFLKSGVRSLRGGGVLVVGCEPTRAASHRGPLADIVWNLRKPVYRLLAKYSSRYHLHRDKEQQRLNDLAEFNRTNGGFEPAVLDDWLKAAGFSHRRVFYGTDPSGFRKYEAPNWKLFVLKALSFQNPLLRANWVNVTAMGRKDSSLASLETQREPAANRSPARSASQAS